MNTQPHHELGGSHTASKASNDLGRAILEGAINDESKDTAVELAEIGLDSLLDEGVLREVPVLRTVLAARKTWAAVHDQLFLRKVAGFIQSSPKFTQEERESFVRECLSGPKEAKKLGDTIVLILDKLDDLDKPTMLAKVFAALVRRRIDVECFRRLATAIDIGFADDLRQFAMQTSPSQEQMKALYPGLVRTGLVELVGTIVPGESKLPLTKIRCDVSALGQAFRDCLNT